MGEYIDRDAAIQAASIWNGDECTEAWIQSALQKLPAADVRPVVLCRDCIFRSNEWTGCPKLNGTITGDDFFCKCGKKREES